MYPNIYYFTLKQFLTSIDFTKSIFAISEPKYLFNLPAENARLDLWSQLNEQPCQRRYELQSQ